MITMTSKREIYKTKMVLMLRGWINQLKELKLEATDDQELPKGCLDLTVVEIDLAINKMEDLLNFEEHT